MTVYAFGLDEYTYYNARAHKGDLYYYSLGGRLLGALDNTGKTSFYLTDALGSVLASFNNVANSAALKGNQVYGPYGNPRDFQGTINTAKGFTGQYSDSVSGLDYYGSRYYDQVAGVFLSADVKQGNMQGMNPYAYVGGNPETLADPSGQMSCAGPEGPCGWHVSSGGDTNANGAVSIDIVPHSSDLCTLDNCSVTLGGVPFSTNDLKTSSKIRIDFLLAFYNRFAPGYEVAEYDFAKYLYDSGRLNKQGGYWDSVDYRLIADALLAAFDYLHGLSYQSTTVRDWLALMLHPTDNGFWVAHNGSIGDQQARASGLYSKETAVEQVYINNAVHTVNDVQFVTQGDDNPLAPLLGPRSPVTGILNKLFEPQQYSNQSDLVALSKEASVAASGGALAGVGIGVLKGGEPGAVGGGVIGDVAGLGTFLSTLFPT